MSARIRALKAGRPPRRPTPEEVTASLPPEILHSVNLLAQLRREREDYLDGPSMASVLLKQAKGDYLKDQMQQANEMGMGGTVSPMIASILQLDRQ